MDRATELNLIDELLNLKADESAFLDEAVTRNGVEHYFSEERFQQERDRIFRKRPLVAAHASEMANAGDFLRREVAGQPVLLTRDRSGKVHAFLNVCRHRGTRLVDEEAGCRHRFACPYHAWTYSNEGQLIAAPHFEAGFGEIDKAELSLKELTCIERFGFIWVVCDGASEREFDAHFAPVSEDLAALHMDEMVVVHQDVAIRRANWKILVEGGIEAYHFKIAHRTTIGPHFEDNLSSYQKMGPHIRSVLPRTSMAKLTEDTRETWRLRDHAQVLYTLFPNAALLVQQDHIAWINQEAISAGETRVRLSTLVPRNEAHRTDHWKRNHKITSVTLEEDFVIGESIQESIASGANSHMLFGKFEGALHVFNQIVEGALAPEEGLPE